MKIQKKVSSLAVLVLSASLVFNFVSCSSDSSSSSSLKDTPTPTETVPTSNKATGVEAIKASDLPATEAVKNVSSLADALYVVRAISDAQYDEIGIDAVQSNVKKWAFDLVNEIKSSGDSDDEVSAMIKNDGSVSKPVTVISLYKEEFPVLYGNVMEFAQDVMSGEKASLKINYNNLGSIEGLPAGFTGGISKLALDVTAGITTPSEEDPASYYSATVNVNNIDVAANVEIDVTKSVELYRERKLSDTEKEIQKLEANIAGWEVALEAENAKENPNEDYINSLKDNINMTSWYLEDCKDSLENLDEYDSALKSIALKAAVNGNLSIYAGDTDNDLNIVPVSPVEILKCILGAVDEAAVSGKLALGVSAGATISYDGYGAKVIATGNIVFDGSLTQADAEKFMAIDEAAKQYSNGKINSAEFDDVIKTTLNSLPFSIDVDVDFYDDNNNKTFTLYSADSLGSVYELMQILPKIIK